jgi:hypothetical protein
MNKELFALNNSFIANSIGLVLKQLGLFLCFLISNNILGQEKLQNLNSQTKSDLYQNQSVQAGSFWPQIIDSKDSLTSKKSIHFSYSKDYLITIKDSNATSISVTPLLDMSMGRQYHNDTTSTLFQNTRGIHIKGSFADKIYFESGFLENQARFTSWETSYYTSLGEKSIKTNSDGSIDTVTINASIPGAARTKPFKTNGFDYGYAWGQMIFRPMNWLDISLGNSQQFIGAGERSLLLSDNCTMAPFVRVNIKFSDKVSYIAQYSKLNDLMRRRYYTTVEAPFQRKTMMSHYLTFAPTKEFNFSIFDAVLQNNELNNESIPLTWETLSPLPLAATILANNTQSHYSIIGFNAEYRPKQFMLLYAQGALQGKKLWDKSLQIGTRLFFALGKIKLTQQFEANLYSNAHLISDVSYSHANVPLNGLQANGMHELIAKGRISYNKFYARYHISVFLDKEQVAKYNLQGEIGYCWNASYNGNLFALVKSRNEYNSTGIAQSGTSIHIGIKTSILNHYTNF